jgi:hypothetical protein
MKNLLRIRFLQIYRELLNAGLWAVFVGLVIYASIIIRITKSSVLPPTPNEFALIFGMLVFSIHSIRKDKRILSVVLPEKQKFYYLLEYGVWSLPLIIPLLVHRDFIGIIIFYCCCLVTVILDISIKFGDKWKKVLLNYFIEKDNFEWLAGMRKVQYPLIILYIFCLAISYWHFAGFICLGVITFLFSKFYDECENRTILTLINETSTSFIKEKLKKQVIQYLKFIAPILLVYIFHYSDKWILYVPLTIVYLANYILYILNKYKSYEPNQVLRANIVYVAITLLGMFIPYLFPISLILVFVFYSKAIQNLKPYFNA